MKEKKTILISILSVWTIRNILLSGIYDELKEKYEIVILTSKTFKPVLLHYHITEKIIVTDKIELNRRFNFLNNIIISSFSKFQNKGTVLSIRKKTIGANKNYKSKIFDFLVNSISNLIISLRLFFKLEKYWLKMMTRRIPVEFIDEVKALRPDKIFSTSFVLPIERTIILTAYKLEIPVTTHILSFDNLTSRGYLPIRKIDKFLVWNEAMKDELVLLYNINEETIKITGTPQFNFHSPKSILPKEDIYKKYSIPKNKQYIVYAANHYYHTPGEPELLESIIQHFSKTELKNIHWVLRFHPLDNYSRWQNLIDKYPDNLSVSIPWKKFKEIDQTGLLSAKDLIDFSSLLSHSLVILNIASTITIDASIVNRPVFCIAYHPFNLREDEYYKRIHKSEHYKFIMEFNASPLINNADELFYEIKEIVDNNDRFETNRKILAKHYIGNTLNNANSLIISNI